MYEKREVKLLGLILSVYGLDKYESLPKGTPISAMFFCCGRGQTQNDLEYACQKMCTVNDTRNPNDRYLILITIDHPNMGNRNAYTTDPLPSPGSFVYQDYVLQMYLHGKGTAYCISNIIECFEYYVLGEFKKPRIEKWGVIGFSMGGITAAVLPEIEPKISTVILLAASPDLYDWMECFIRASRLETDFYYPYNYRKIIEHGSSKILASFKNIKLLLLDGNRDRFCPSHLNSNVEKQLESILVGQKGYDWNSISLPVKKHDVVEEYITESSLWIKKWMTTTDFQQHESKI